jgi:hypothetical protein
MPPVHKPEVVKGVLVKKPYRRDPRMMQPRTAPTYRLVLLREDTGQILHAWSQIPQERVAPLLEVMQRYLPWLARAAAAKDALAKLLDLFR